ncbi:MAG TPA: 16S rRNA (uracil(1498)-N(3))-methyltransferase [Bacteroidales bacterium]|nr:16S rRNA (uracil(1498)-N(3))-methyltransferase [Bacteroidales bacterium]
MAIFYTPDILTNPCLSEEESVHCVRVLRLGEGAEIDLIDGRGTFYKARIVQAHPKHCMVEVLETIPDKSPAFMAQIAVAPTKNFERMEWFIEKATEVGIGGFHFIGSQHSERKNLKLERVEKIVIAALKQSMKALKPQIGELIDFKKFVSLPFDGQKYICHCNPGSKPLLHHLCKAGTPVLVLIGPEGDFSPDEVELALKYDFQEVSLGDTRLRTETAAFVAAHIVCLKNM